MRSTISSVTAATIAGKSPAAKASRIAAPAAPKPCESSIAAYVFAEQ